VAVVARARPSVRALRAPLLRRACLALLVVAATAEAQPAVAPARLVAAQSEITFQVKQSGVPVDGRFRSFDAQIALDPKAPQTGSVTLSIDTASATVGFAESDAELPRSAWFNAQKFPRAVFQSSAIKAVGAGRLQVAGKLAIKGTSQELVVPVTIVQAGALSTATGEFIVKRLDFKIGENEWADVSLVANDVRVRFKLVLSGLGPLP
jgi:polyisoprenoid-binding protein YceI